MILPAFVLFYGLLVAPAIDSKWIDPSWKMIPVRGYVQLNNRKFNLAEPMEIPQAIAKKVVSKISQKFSSIAALKSPVVQAQMLANQAAEPSPAPVPVAESPVVEPAEFPAVEPAQAPAVPTEPELQEPVVETSSEFVQAPVVEISSTSTTTTTTTTTTTPAPTTRTTTTIAPRKMPVAPVKTYVSPTKTQTIVQTPVVKEEAIKAPTKTVVKSTPSKTSAPKEETKTSTKSSKQVVQAPSKYVSPAKNARVFSQSHF